MADQSFLSWPFFEAQHRKLTMDQSRWAAARTGELVDHHDIDSRASS